MFDCFWGRCGTDVEDQKDAKRLKRTQGGGSRAAQDGPRGDQKDPKRLKRIQGGGSRGGQQMEMLIYQTAKKNTAFCTKNAILCSLTFDLRGYIWGTRLLGRDIGRSTGTPLGEENG